MAFTDTIQRWLEGIAAQKDRWSLDHIVKPIGDRMSSLSLSTAGLVISSGGATTAKTGAADSYYLANGVLVKIASGTAMPALVGSITAANFNVFCFFVDSNGTVTVAMGVQATTLAGVLFPSFPKNKALLGFLLVTYASPFIGGTTPLDTATTVYFSPTEGFDPAILTG